MKLKLHDTTIYFKVYADYDTPGKESFLRLCNKLEKFPLNKMHPHHIKGLYLGGEYYFRKILFSEAGEVAPEEIRKTEEITPIIEKGLIPFILSQGCFEVSIPTEGNSLEELMNYISQIDTYLDNLPGNSTGKKIEIHLKGGSGSHLLKQIIREALPRLGGGTYQYNAVTDKRGDGEILLPTEFSRLPEHVRRLGEIEVVCNDYSLKLIQKKNKLILRPLKKILLALSLYSDQCEWFQNTLRTFDEAELFDRITDEKTYLSLPRM
ncbi:hypothetical protein QUF72_08805 [Desulfobacterales bacterium HSG2]|nr:hypothetical protein [Desulfobacterales bacterium HSG2]